MRNILIGGKMGDFIHSLILPKYVFDVTGEKFNIYICNHSQEVFASGINNSYRDLLPLMENQPYINSFEIWDNQHIDINLTRFRDYSNLYEVSWNEFYLWNYIGTNIKVPFNYSWINIEKDNTYKDLLLINRNLKPIPNQEVEKHYLNYIEGYKGKAFFVCSWIDQYLSSPFKDIIPMLYLPSLKDITTAIASCNHFLGNLTATAAIATSVNTNRTIEMEQGMYEVIKINYIKEMKNYSTLSCFG